ncbi:hypothetical protein IO707_004207 [Vibrio vulnificus]|nr:hypothetical protein [Vibrio vulnificus]
MSNTVLIPIGVVTASIIAGLFSFVTLILSKEQKVSEFRQQWIDGLREDVAQFIGNITTISDVTERILWDEMDGKEPDYTRSDVKDLQVAASEAYTRIILRLNPHDTNESVISLIECLQISRGQIKEGDWLAVYESIDDIRTRSQELLKLEWERVKTGEPAFKWAKRIAVFCVVTAIIFGASYLGLVVIN